MSMIFLVFSCRCTSFGLDCFDWLNLSSEKYYTVRFASFEIHCDILAHL